MGKIKERLILWLMKKWKAKLFIWRKMRRVSEEYLDILAKQDVMVNKV